MEPLGNSGRFNAAVAKTMIPQTTMNLGPKGQSCDIDQSTPMAAKKLINNRDMGALFFDGKYRLNIANAARDEFAKSMDELSAYMVSENISTIVMPDVRKLKPLQGAVLFAAVNAGMQLYNGSIDRLCTGAGVALS